MQSTSSTNTTSVMDLLTINRKIPSTEQVTTSVISSREYKITCINWLVSSCRLLCRVAIFLFK